MKFSTASMMRVVIGKFTFKFAKTGNNLGKTKNARKPVTAKVIIRIIIGGLIIADKGKRYVVLFLSKYFHRMDYIFIPSMKKKNPCRKK